MFSNFKIGTKLLLIFLLIGLIPAATIAGIALWQSREALSEQAFKQLQSMRDVQHLHLTSYFEERKVDMQVLLDTVSNLRHNALQKLQSVQENKAAQIETYLQSKVNDIRILSRTETVAHAIEQFSEAMELDGGEPGLAWNSLKELLDPELQNYRKTLNYQDLLLIDTQGLVVYSGLQNDDFATNLLQGAYNNTALSGAVKDVLNRRQPRLQDFALYPPAGNKPVMFTLGPVYRFDKLVGVLAFRMGAEQLDEITQRRKGMGETGESYLVGRAIDKETAVYRSSRKLNGREQLSIGEPAEGLDVLAALTGNSGLLWKYGINGQLLISVYSSLNLPDLEWGLISSINVEEILTPRLDNEQQNFFQKYVEQHQYYDLFLIHPEGKIFYSIKHEDDYNSNILSGPYAKSGLGDLVRRILNKKEYTVTDYAPYEPSNNHPAAFAGQPLLSSEGEIELIVAVQLDENALNGVMQRYEGMGQTGETYLVGEDHLMRSNSYLSPKTHSIKNSFQHPEFGKVVTMSVLTAHTGKTGEIEDVNHHGDKVLSAYRPLEVGDNTWALVAEIHSQEAFAAIHKQELFMMLIALGGIVGVWLLSGRFTQALVVPLMQVNYNLKRLAEGELVEQEILYRGEDEIAELIGSAQRLRNALDTTIVQANAIASGDYHREVKLLSERDRLGNALSEMTSTLRHMVQTNTDQTWLKSGLAELNEYMRGVQDITPLAKNMIHFLAKYLQAQIGTFYVYRNEELHLIASYAYTQRRANISKFQLGEGLIGQAALEQEMMIIRDLPPEYILVQSSLGQGVPHNVLLLPVMYENQLKGVIELGRFQDFSALEQEFMNQAAPGIGIGVYTAESRSQLKELLIQTQEQAQEMQSQAEELQAQQEELRQSNDELEQRTQDLECQKERIRANNIELEQATKALQEKAEELELASRYKSEFLANMSHELRTPLNSLLILAQLLAANKDKNLNEKQIEHARTIHHAGQDLLDLINEILDLSKIEAGRIELSPEKIRLQDLIQLFERRFRYMAEERGIKYQIICDEQLPALIQNDGQRLQQIITNLVSNALKFTDKGGQVILAFRPAEGHEPGLPAHLQEVPALAISVTDTGIGIPKDKQSLVFEAFRQADGSTSRKYGGTGLGLSISRQLAHLMEGALTLHSIEGKGSTFTLFVPQQVGGPIIGDSLHSFEPEEAAPELAPVAESEEEGFAAIPPPSKLMPADDREQLGADESCLLIVEDDSKFSALLLEMAREHRFKCLLASDGQQALELVKHYRVTAIILDLGLPKIDGLSVLERLKDDSLTRHIPIHCISAAEQGLEAQQRGALGYLLKPAGMDELSSVFGRLKNFLNQNVKQLLVVSQNSQRSNDIDNLLRNEHIHIQHADSPEQAWSMIQQQELDCIIIDAEAEPSQAPWPLLDHIQSEALTIPVLVYANRQLDSSEEKRLEAYQKHLIIKAARSQEYLLDGAMLFLHQMESLLAPDQQHMLKNLHKKQEAALNGKTVLLVDDDIRNIYSLSAALEEKEMRVIMAKNGLKALEALENHPKIDIVLMDIMMPEMDGYEAMQQIRQQEHFKQLPIIALTAKAMKDDKSKCIQAGANDYLPKPVDISKLISLMRIWLYR